MRGRWSTSMTRSMRSMSSARRTGPTAAKIERSAVPTFDATDFEAIEPDDPRLAGLAPSGLNSAMTAPASRKNTMATVVAR